MAAGAFAARHTCYSRENAQFSHTAHVHVHCTVMVQQVAEAVTGFSYGCNWLQIMKKFLMQKMATCNRLLFVVRQLAIYGLQIGAAAVAISCGCCCK